MSRNVKLRYFLSRNVEIRAMSRKNGINCDASWLRILCCSGVRSATAGVNGALWWRKEARKQNTFHFKEKFSVSLVNLALKMPDLLWINCMGDKKHWKHIFFFFLTNRVFISHYIVISLCQEPRNKDIGKLMKRILWIKLNL